MVETIRAYIAGGMLPSEKWTARKFKAQAERYVLVDGEIYKWRFSRPLMTCVERNKAQKVCPKEWRTWSSDGAWRERLSCCGSMVVRVSYCMMTYIRRQRTCGHVDPFGVYRENDFSAVCWTSPLNTMSGVMFRVSAFSSSPRSR